MVQASGTLVLIGGIGASLGPVSVAVMMASIGPDGFFWWLAAIHAAIGLFAVWRMTQRQALPVAEQGPYVALPPRATPAASALYAEAAEAEARPEQRRRLVQLEVEQRDLGIEKIDLAAPPDPAIGSSAAR